MDFCFYVGIPPQIEKILEPNAKRIGLTSRQAVLLLVINAEKDFDLTKYQEFNNKLSMVKSEVDKIKIQSVKNYDKGYIKIKRLAIMQVFLFYQY